MKRKVLKRAGYTLVGVMALVVVPACAGDGSSDSETDGEMSFQELLQQPEAQLQEQAQLLLPGEDRQVLTSGVLRKPSLDRWTLDLVGASDAPCAFEHSGPKMTLAPVVMGPVELQSGQRDLYVIRAGGGPAINPSAGWVRLDIRSEQEGAAGAMVWLAEDEAGVEIARSFGTFNVVFCE